MGIGVRVYVDGCFGFASTSVMTRASVAQVLVRAVKLARASRKKAANSGFVSVRTMRDDVELKVREDPINVSAEDATKIVLEANKAAARKGIRNRSTNLGTYVDDRLLVSTEGTRIKLKTSMTGLAHRSIAFEAGVMEQVYDTESLCSGFEFIRSKDWQELTARVSKEATRAVSSKAPKAGRYEVVADSRLVGLFMHEALGHASEGDLVSGGASVLKGRLRQKIGTELTTIIDDGRVEGGYFVPYDDEGVKKTPTTVVQDGVLNQYLSSRQTASELGVPATGNGRAQDFENSPIVRMTNIFLKPRDMSLEELMEEMSSDGGEGMYLVGRGGGGQVDVGGGTFTFSIGPSYMVRKGELAEMVRGSNVSGSVLETLGNIVAVGKDLEVRTGVFGGCGKDGQQAKVGLGGPPVRISRLNVGGEVR